MRYWQVTPGNFQLFEGFAAKASELCKQLRIALR